jgi:hypothetical protein
MSYIDHNPRLAWAEAFETGIRTQACADPEEAGAKVQTSNAKGGGGYNDHYVPVYSMIKRMEREQPSLAAVGHWLCLNDTGEANQYLDDVADTLLTRFILATPAWPSYREARRERIEALIQARMMQDRNNIDGTRPSWQPKEVCFYAREYMGVKIVSDNWQRDGWDAVWLLLGDLLSQLESEAMTPISDIAYQANKAMRNYLRHAA